MKTLELAIEKHGDKLSWDPKLHVSASMGLKLKDKGAERSRGTVERQLEFVDA